MLFLGRTAEQEFTEWAISQDLSDSTIQLLKSHGIVSKRSLQRATDADIEALASLLPLFQQRYLKEAKVSLSGGQLSTSSSASNVVSSSDEVDGRKCMSCLAYEADGTIAVHYCFAMFFYMYSCEEQFECINFFSIISTASVFYV